MWNMRVLGNKCWLRIGKIVCFLASSDKVGKFVPSKIKDVFCAKSSVFSTLMPIDSIEVRNSYIKSLDFAFNKENHIHNLGITGDLGIGKTSVIQSYLKMRNKRWIGVSLADLSDGNKDDKTRELEKKILLQLMANKTNVHGMEKILLKVFLFIIGIILWHNCIGFPSLVSELVITILSIIITCVSDNMIAAVCVSAVILAIIGMICKMIVAWCEELHYKIHFSILGQFEVDLEKIFANEDFNKHLRLLIKYFDSIPANIVLIEDLDRFNNIDIFIKLHELNHLLNLALEDDVIFVYAMKESTFKDALTKTKFFDFIIPILPEAYEINTEGIFQKKIISFLNKSDAMKSEIEPCSRLIRCMAPHIRDYRLLNNICNEFVIYAEILSERLKNDSKGKDAFHMYTLLAVIFYKNFYPCDFEKTCRQQGVLSGIFNNRHSNASKLKFKILEDVEKIKDENNKINEKIRSNIMKWKKRVLDKLGMSSSSILQFDYPSGSINYWDDFLEGDLTVVQLDVQKILSGWETVKFCFKDESLEKRSYTFSNLNIKGLKSDMVDIYQNIKLYKLRCAKWKQLEASAMHIVSWSLRQQLQITNNSDFMLPGLPQEGEIDSYDTRPAIIMLSQGPEDTTGGFLDESYRQYLSVFQEGGISESDYFFLAAVQSHKRLSYTYHLDDPTRILEQIQPDECSHIAIWNKSIIDYLIRNSKSFANDSYIHNITIMLLEHSLYDDKLIWEYFENSTEEEQEFFFSYLRSEGRSVSTLFWNRADIPIDHKIAYLKAIIMSPTASDYSDVSINLFLMQPIILVNFDWGDGRFRAHFKHYMEKANLNWPAVEIVKQETSSESEAKRAALLKAMESIYIKHE